MQETQLNKLESQLIKVRETGQAYLDYGEAIEELLLAHKNYMTNPKIRSSLLFYQAALTKLEACLKRIGELQLKYRLEEGNPT